VVYTNGRGGHLMGCNCGRKVGTAPAAKSATRTPASRIVEEYKYLKPYQIKARLEIFKRNYCPNCETRYQCDYNMYLTCTKRPQ
jgi:hypothetical protein